MNLPFIPIDFPESGGWNAFLRNFFVFAVVLCIFGIALRLICGKESRICRTVAVSLSVQLTYLIVIGLYLLLPLLRRQLYALPFVRVNGYDFVLQDLTQAAVHSLSGGLVRLWILSMIITVLESVLPAGQKFYKWLLWRLLSAMLSMALYSFLCPLLDAAIPRIFETEGVTVVLCIWALIVLVGLLSLLRKIVLASSGKILGGMHHFFFSSRAGFCLTGSMISTAVVLAALFLLNRDGIGTFAFAEFALLPYACTGLIVTALLFLFMRFL